MTFLSIATTVVLGYVLGLLQLCTLTSPSA